MNDGELLRAYVQEGSEPAFTELVNRYVNLVHSVVSRHVTDRSVSQEVTQTVFALLARKARSLVGHPSIAGWLHRAAWQLAARTARTEVRRRRWESEAAATHLSFMPDTPEDPPILPALDEALQELNEPDRDAIVLRYFLRQPLRDVGTSLGTSEAAAKMRLRRALNHLRTLLARRGITCSPAALAAAIFEHGVAPAPPTLAPRAIEASLNAGGRIAPFTPLIHGMLSLMNGTKLAVLLLAVVLVAVLSTITLRQRQTEDSVGAEIPLVTADTRNTPKLSAFGLSRLTPAGRQAALLTPEELEAARQRLRQALATPVPKSGIIWPDPGVLEAMAAFGSQQDELFAALKEAFLDPGSQDTEFASNPAATRAIRALGELDKAIPGLTSFLWETTAQGDWSGRVGALGALRKLGLEASDLPALTKLLQDSAIQGSSPALCSQLPAALQELFLRDPQAAAAYLPRLTSVLEGATDPVTRFTAACALLGTPPGSDPAVIELIRNGLREGLNVSPTDRRGVNVHIAIDRAAAAGEAAKPLIPDLLEVAQTSHDAHQRTAAFLAVGRIQPELRAEIPELDQALSRAEEQNQVREAVNQGFGSQEDLIRALKDPTAAVKAATTLGETGLNLPEVVPAMVAALAGMDEDSRDQVVAAIRKLDPQAQIERVPADVMFHGVIFANSAFDSRPSAAKDPRLERLLSDLHLFHTWRTPEEVLTVTKNLVALDLPTAQAFVSGLAEKDPGLADRARVLLSAPAQP